MGPMKTQPTPGSVAPVLFQILDGLWFLEVEKEVGFEKALDIDRAVWEVYSRKEAERLMTARRLTPGEGTISMLQELLPASMFNQTLEHKCALAEDGQSLIFYITECKTLAGLERVGRPSEQIYRICKEIGLAFFASFAHAVNPSIQVECHFCPSMPAEEKCDDEELEAQGGLCGWKFFIAPP